MVYRVEVVQVHVIIPTHHCRLTVLPARVVHEMAQRIMLGLVVLVIAAINLAEVAVSVHVHTPIHHCRLIVLQLKVVQEMERFTIMRVVIRVMQGISTVATKLVVRETLQAQIA